jgi:hypothetical protein
MLNTFEDLLLVRPERMESAQTAHSTVTLFARLRGLSMLRPFEFATW